MLTNSSAHTLSQALLMVEAIVPLLIRTGIGYGEFSAACKPLFYRQAVIEAKRTQQKTTDSSISLISGLHRRDTANLRKAIEDDPHLQNPPISQPANVPKQVIANWLVQNNSDTLPIQGENNSFEALVTQVSKDQHPRSILTELKRLGIVSADKHTVTLQRHAFTPNPQSKEAREILAQNVADHIAAGLINLFANTANNDTGVLEQAVFSDELTQESIDELHQLANQLWADVMQQTLKRAIELHKQDQQKDHANLRFRLGMYAFDESTVQQPPHKHKWPHK